MLIIHKKHFLNYIFKKTLGDYITNDLDLNKIEIEIQKNTFISLTNIELNAYEINKKHFHNSPLKMLSGKINKIDLIISTDKIEFNVNDIFILLMPVFNDEKFVNQIQNVKKKGIIENDNNSPLIGYRYEKRSTLSANTNFTNYIRSIFN